MSGGSMDYLYQRVADASFSENSPRRKALRKHLVKLAAVLRAVEWNDSCDGDDRENGLIDDLLGHAAVIGAAVEQAKEAKAELEAVIARAEGKEA